MLNDPHGSDGATLPVIKHLAWACSLELCHTLGDLV